jgi:hypothetical protein
MRRHRDDDAGPGFLKDDSLEFRRKSELNDVSPSGECGLGRTPQQIDWAICLAVSFPTAKEAIG